MTAAMMDVRRVLCLAASFSVLTCGLASSAGATTAPVIAFPSAQTIPASGLLPPGGSTAINVHAARGEREGAWIVARGSRTLGATVEPESLGPIDVELAWGHFVRVGRRLVPDALLPWGGEARAPEQPNQPLYVRVSVPHGTAPGRYTGHVAVTLDVRTVEVPLIIHVFSPTLPKRALPTSFHVSPSSYISAVARLYGYRSATERRAAHASLFRFLAEYGLSPSSWGLSLIHI